MIIKNVSMIKIHVSQPPLRSTRVAIWHLKWANQHDLAFFENRLIDITWFGHLAFLIMKKILSFFRPTLLNFWNSNSNFVKYFGKFSLKIWAFNPLWPGNPEEYWVWFLSKIIQFVKVKILLFMNYWKQYWKLLKNNWKILILIETSIWNFSIIEHYWKININYSLLYCIVSYCIEPRRRCSPSYLKKWCSLQK